MSDPKASQPLTAAPSDERLVDYLLGHSFPQRTGERAGGERAIGGAFDEAIERWLAADEANVRRLESFALAVLAASLPQVAASPPSDPPRRRDAATPAVAVVTAGPLEIAAAAAGLLTLAAAITLAIFWSRPWAAEELSTQRVAVAWAESLALASAGAPGVADSSETLATDGDLDDDWPGDWELAQSDDWLHTQESEAFAAGNDSPPQWLLTALAQMSAGPEFEASDAEAIP